MRQRSLSEDFSLGYVLTIVVLVGLAGYAVWWIFASIAHSLRPEIPAPRVAGAVVRQAIAQYDLGGWRCRGEAPSSPVVYKLGTGMPRTRAMAQADTLSFVGLNVGFLRRIGDISVSMRYEPYETPIGWRATADLTQQGLRDLRAFSYDGSKHRWFCDGMFVPKHVRWLRTYKVDTAPNSPRSFSRLQH
jgi:hypothetical protein